MGRDGKQVGYQGVRAIRIFGMTHVADQSPIDSSAIPGGHRGPAYVARMTRGWEISDRRKALFVVHEGEDPYLAVGRQMEVARPNELGALYMMRDDPAQREAMMLIQSAKKGGVDSPRSVLCAVFDPG